VLEQRLDTPLLKVSQYEESIGATVSSVRRPTYTFGIAAGLLVALLILLQLTFTDSRIRSMRQLTRIAGSDRVLGHLTNTPNEVGERRTALGIHGALGRSHASSVRYLPLRNAVSDDASLQRLTVTAGTKGSVAPPFAELSVAKLSEPSTTEVDVIVVQRNKDLRKDLVEVLAALGRSGRLVAGVLLLD
jgi:hypothetical protein